MKIAERMRSAVEKLRLSTAGGKPLAVTISCGIASLTESVQMPAQLLASADHYLLEAKRAGRNRTIAMPD
jgi:diguanylate cyclase (GGDEF)-like protein